MCLLIIVGLWYFLNVRKIDCFPSRCQVLPAIKVSQFLNVLILLDTAVRLRIHLISSCLSCYSGFLTCLLKRVTWLSSGALFRSEVNGLSLCVERLLLHYMAYTGSPADCHCPTTLQDAKLLFSAPYCPTSGAQPWKHEQSVMSGIAWIPLFNTSLLNALYQLSRIGSVYILSMYKT